jgi:hypothetical protein
VAPSAPQSEHFTMPVNELITRIEHCDRVFTPISSFCLDAPAVSSCFNNTLWNPIMSDLVSPLAQNCNSFMYSEADYALMCASIKEKHEKNVNPREMEVPTVGPDGRPLSFWQRWRIAGELLEKIDDGSKYPIPEGPEGLVVAHLNNLIYDTTDLDGASPGYLLLAGQIIDYYNKYVQDHWSEYTFSNDSNNAEDGKAHASSTCDTENKKDAPDSYDDYKIKNQLLKQIRLSICAGMADDGWFDCPRCDNSKGRGRWWFDCQPFDKTNQKTFFKCNRCGITEITPEDVDNIHKLYGWE